MSGVTRQFFESLPASDNKAVLVVGDVMTGNTDTRFYWNLTRNIWRFSPIRPDGTKNIHTVDERIDMDVHLEGLAFYYGMFLSLTLERGIRIYANFVCDRIDSGI